MAEVRMERRVGLITPNLQRYDAEKAADWIDAIKRQVCPFCGAGPFVVIAHHVNRIHGIDRLTLRDMLGLSTEDSICDPSYSAARSTHTTNLVAVGKLHSGTPPEKRGGRRRVTNSRRAAFDRIKVDFINAGHTPEVEQRRSIAIVAANAAAKSDRNDSIVAALAGAQSVRAICRSLGVGRHVVRTVADAHGIDLVERSQRVERSVGVMP